MEVERGGWAGEEKVALGEVGMVVGVEAKQEVVMEEG